MDKIVSFLTAVVFTLLSFLGIPFESPDLKPIPQIPVRLTEEEAEILSSVFDSETTWLASIQLNNGAIPMTSCKNGEVSVNPYFADIAALALLDCGEKYISQVKDYTEWHFSHLNTTETDYNGIDGTIYDYVISVNDSKVVSEAVATANGIKSYDSTDSYAATFLCVLKKYYDVTGDKEYIISKSRDIRRITDAMFSTLSNGLTFAKPDYEVRYLMDNCEVYNGSVAASELLKISGNNEYAKKCEHIAKKIRYSINGKLMNYFNGNYNVATDKANQTVIDFSWDKYYPCATAQLFPILCGVISPNTERAVSLYNKFCEVYCWENFDIPDIFCWGSNVYTAALMGDTERVVRYMTKYKNTFAEHAYPLYNADSARVAMAAKKLLDSK